MWFQIGMQKVVQTELLKSKMIYFFKGKSWAQNPVGHGPTPMQKLLKMCFCHPPSLHYLSVSVLTATSRFAAIFLTQLTSYPNEGECYWTWTKLSSVSSPSRIQVSVPVKFNGASGIQVRTPPNLADLASYTSLKFYITLPEAARSRRQDDGAKQFVFYLGNKDVSVSMRTHPCSDFI